MNPLRTDEITTMKESKIHCSDVIMGKMVSQINSFTIAYSTVYSGTERRKHKSSTVTGEFPAQRDSNAENVSIWWCHHECSVLLWGQVTHVSLVPSHYLNQHYLTINCIFYQQTLESKYDNFHSRKYRWKYCLKNMLANSFRPQCVGNVINLHSTLL